jgi:hypothetical protein
MLYRVHIEVVLDIEADSYQEAKDIAEDAHDSIAAIMEVIAPTGGQVETASFWRVEKDGKRNG